MQAAEPRDIKMSGICRQQGIQCTLGRGEEETERILHPYSPLAAFSKQKWEERLRKVEGIIEQGELGG